MKSYPVGFRCLEEANRESAGELNSPPYRRQAKLGKSILQFGINCAGHQSLSCLMIAATKPSRTVVLRSFRSSWCPVRSPYRSTHRSPQIGVQLTCSITAASGCLSGGCQQSAALSPVGAYGHGQRRASASRWCRLAQLVRQLVGQCLQYRIAHVTNGALVRVAPLRKRARPRSCPRAACPPRFHAQYQFLDDLRQVKPRQCIC